MNSRAKGRRTEAKAVEYAMTFPGVRVLKWYQLNTRFHTSTDQVFDLLVLRDQYWPRFVEVRTNQWGLSKPQTKSLASLPGEGYFKQVWLWRDGESMPKLRQWDDGTWLYQHEPWESAT